MKFSFVILSSVLTFNAYAADVACETALGLVEREAGLGARGFIGANPAANDLESAVAELAARGILPWFERIFVVPREDDIYHQAYVNARAPDLRLTHFAEPLGRPTGRPAKGAAWVTAALDHLTYLITQTDHPVRHHPLTSGLYVVVPNFSYTTEKPADALARVIPSLGERAMFEVDAESRLRALDPALVRRLFAHAAVRVQEAEGLTGAHLRVDGFFHPRHRARVPLARLASHPGAIDPGYTFTVTAHPDCVEIETRRFNPKIRDAERVAIVTGVVHEGVFIVTKFAAVKESRKSDLKMGEAEVEPIDPVPLKARYPFARVERELADLGVVEVDLTKVEDLYGVVEG